MVDVLIEKLAKFERSGHSGGHEWPLTSKGSYNVTQRFSITKTELLPHLGKAMQDDKTQDHPRHTSHDHNADEVVPPTDNLELRLVDRPDELSL